MVASPPTFCLLPSINNIFAEMILRRSISDGGARLDLRQTQADIPLVSSTPSPEVPINRPAQNTTKIIPNQTPIVVITLVFIGLVVAFLIVFSIYRHFQVSREPFRGISRSCLKSLWPKSGSNNQEYQTPGSNDNIYAINEHAERSTAALDSNDAPRTFTMSERAASLRSVITLPSYMQTARKTEKVLGREGERAGMDVVVEFPKTAQEEEQRREEEMEALYQVRLARRRENEVREGRRRLRREVEERGERLTTREIEEYERRVTNELPGQSIEELRAEHDRLKRQRQRAVSIVSYADIGVARHDGTRLSLTNQDNEHVGLLGDAASISASTQINQRDRPGSTHSASSNNSDAPQNSIQHRTHSRAPHSYFSNIPRRRSTSCNFIQTPNRNTSSSSLMTRIWRSPRGSPRRASSPTEIPNSEEFDNTSLRRQSYTQLNAPPRYGPELPVTATNSTEQPPEYSIERIDETERQPGPNEAAHDTPEPDRYTRGSPSTIQSTNERSELISPSRRSVNNMLQASNSRDLAPRLPDLNLESSPMIVVNTSKPISETIKKSNRNLT